MRVCALHCGHASGSGGSRRLGWNARPASWRGSVSPGEAAPTSRRVTALSEGVCTAPSAGGGAEPTRPHGAGVA